MNTRDRANLGGQRANVLEAAAVDADAVLEDALADGLLGHRANGRRDLLLAALELRVECSVGRSLDLVETVLALLLVGDLQRGGQVRLGCCSHGGEDVVLVVEEARELPGLLGGLARELDLRLAQRLEERLRRLEALGHDRLGGRLGALGDQGEGVVGGLGLDHHDGDVVASDAAGNDHVEHRALLLGVLGERDPLAVDERDAHAGDGAGERQA